MLQCRQLGETFFSPSQYTSFFIFIVLGLGELGEQRTNSLAFLDIVILGVGTFVLLVRSEDRQPRGAGSPPHHVEPGVELVLGMGSEDRQPRGVGSPLRVEPRD